MMILIAFSSLVISTFSYLNSKIQDFPTMPWVSRLQMMQVVRFANDIQLVTRRGECLIPAGTKAVVVFEPAWDDDSCYPRREVRVVIMDGKFQEKTISIRRDFLRLANP